MLSVVTLDDMNGNPVTLHLDAVGSKRGLTEAHGLRGIQSLRQSKRVRPQAHGGINETRYEDGRSITLVGEIVSQVGIEDAFNEFQLITAPIIQTLDVGPALLKWTEGATGNQLQRLVKLDGDLDPPFQEGNAVLSYQAQFFAEDPRAYSQAQQTVSIFPGSTSAAGHTFPTTYPRTYTSGALGVNVVTNGGNRSTPPLFRIFGMAQNPAIILGNNTQRLGFIGTINAGDYLEIDAAKRTVTLFAAGGQPPINRLVMYDSPNSTWFDLAPGNSNVSLTAASNDANTRLDVLLRNAWA